MVITTLKELWSKMDGTHRPTQYSEEAFTTKDKDARNAEPRHVRNPALSLLGMATPGQFYGALNTSAIEGGFLNRLINAMARDRSRRLHRNRQFIGNIVWAAYARVIEFPAVLIPDGMDMEDWCTLVAAGATILASLAENALNLAERRHKRAA